jgi:hypothetical protein
MGSGLAVDVTWADRAVQLVFSSRSGSFAIAKIPFDHHLDDFEVQPLKRGLLLRAQLPPLAGTSKARRWALRLIPVTDEPLIEIVEVSSINTGAWTLEFTGEALHVQKQLELVTSSIDDSRFRFGGFTQHGQLLDLKDWFFVERAGMCAGLLALRPGAWTHPTITVAEARGEGDTLRLELPHGSGRVRRSFLLACASADQVLSRYKTGQRDFEPRDGYARWPARQIARFGFARLERLDAYARTAELMDRSRPTRFAFGDHQAMKRAMSRACGEPDLSANPFWTGDYAAAKAWMFKTLHRFDTALREGAYLHPIGNPVAARALGPAAGLFHMLDFQGELSDTERTQAAALIATLAELLFRRDFYPHDFATEAPEFPYTSASLYRGMLNQNFNTDRFVFVGLAGCVLPSHPHAARWRQHAVEQFESQMRAYVYPGGCWEESHTYANHVKMTLLPLVLALRHAPGAGVDLMANENFLATCRFFIPLLSPPEPSSPHHRRVPAIGDHELGKHDDFGCVFGWLATLCPNHRDEFLWAWNVQGSPASESSSMQATTFSPLLLPDRDIAPPPAPSLPNVQSLPGYGAYARRAFGTEDESLLVVRCGPAWGHYHNDQGSFWWWVRNRLVCCDAGLGSGDLKFAHVGHNVPGYVGHEPRQWLDRHPYEIDRCEQSHDGTVTIRGQIPTVHWMHASDPQEQIPEYQRPHVIRTFDWLGLNELRLTDTFERSPGGLATFTLHTLSRQIRRSGPTEIEFDLAPGVLRLQLPAEPKDVRFHHDPETIGVTCTYAEGTLVHELWIG